MGDKAADVAGHFAVIGLGTAIAADTAMQMAIEHVGGGFIGEQLVGPIAGIAGGVVGSAVGSTVYQNLPTIDTVSAVTRELCPTRAPRMVNQGGPMHSSMDGLHEGQLVSSSIFKNHYCNVNHKPD